MILLVLAALAARVDAAPGDASIALAVRYANALTGVADHDGVAAPDDPDGRDETDEADEADEADESGEADAAADALASAIDLANAPDTGARDAGAPDAIRGGMGGGDDAPERDAGRLAMRAAEQAPAGAVTDDDASLAASPAGAFETYESWMRPHRPSRWGRLDLGLACRSRWSEPMSDLPRRSDELWLVATWRR